MSAWFDSHCHLDRLPAAALDRARERGVDAFVVPGLAGCTAQALALASQSPSVRCLVGWHPLHLEDWGPDRTEEMSAQLQSDARLCGVGEVGLDERGPALRVQEEALSAQLAVAAAVACPVSIHLVGAWGAFLSLARRFPQLTFVMHAYSGSTEFAARLLRELPSVYFGVGGRVTHPNARRLRATLPTLPVDRLVLETDAPDMSPHGHEGPNEPATLPGIGAHVAAILGVESVTLARESHENARRAFRWRSVSTD